MAVLRESCGGSRQSQSEDREPTSATWQASNSVLKTAGRDGDVPRFHKVARMDVAEAEANRPVGVAPAMAERGGSQRGDSKDEPQQWKKIATMT